MFPELVKKFHETVDQTKACWASIYADGQLTQVRVTFRPNMALEVRGLTGDAPPYLLLTANGMAYQDPDRETELTTDDGKASQLYRLWDPRVLVRGMVTEEQGPSRIRGRVTYDIKKTGLSLHPDQSAWLEERAGRGEAAFERDFEFVHQNGLWLLDIVQDDFSGFPQIALRFNYKEYTRPEFS